MSKRAVILSTAIAFCFIIVIFRLADRMLINHGRLSERARLQHLKREDIQVRRGIICDRRGRELAVNLEVESLYCNPRQVDSPRAVASAISAVTGKPYDALYEMLSREEQFIWIERKLELAVAEKLREEIARRFLEGDGNRTRGKTRRARKEVLRKLKESGYGGVGFLPDAKRFYPKGALASHVIGFAGVDNQPLEGVELRYDLTLRNKGGMLYVARDAKGNTLSEGMEFESKGNTIALTIDEGLQYIAEKELGKAMLKWGASQGSVIMMEPFTGEILALANRPTYDPNEPAAVRNSDRRNIALTDTYEPGSTFKIIVGTASLEDGAVGIDSRFDCTKGYIEVGGKLIRDAHRNGFLTFKEVIQKSSNVGSVMLGLKLGREKLYSYARKFGFGQKTGIDLPGEAAGRLKPPSGWSAPSIGAISIGYEVSVTGLQVLRAYSAIANGGYLVTPHVVSEIRSPDGNIISGFRPEAPKRVISERTAAVFKKILESVTEEGGTAARASVYGNLVAGKTGTAKLIDKKTGGYSDSDYVSSFVGFVPAEAPKIAMIVVVFKPKGEIYGGAVAGPVFKNIATKALAYLNVPMDGREAENTLVVRNIGYDFRNSFKGYGDSVNQRQH